MIRDTKSDTSKGPILIVYPRDVYGPNFNFGNFAVPGYKVIGFRNPKPGDIFVDLGFNPRTAKSNLSPGSFNPRLILEKLPEHLLIRFTEIRKGGYVMPGEYYETNDGIKLCGPIQTFIGKLTRIFRRDDVIVED